MLIGAMGLVNMVMVGYVGEHAVSGVSLVETITYLFILSFTALATGGAVVASQYIGRGDRKNACLSAHQLIYIIIAVSMFFMILSLIFCRPVLKLVYGVIADDVMQSAQIYFLISAFSFPFIGLYSAAAALFRSMGNSAVTMRTALFVNVINLAGNVLFIFGLGLGTAGAALATLIGRLAAAFILVFLLVRNDSAIISLRGINRINIEPQMIKRILNVGIPSGLETSMFQFGKIIIARIFTAFGTAAIAANAVANVINSLGFMTGSAFGLGLLTVVGQCIGAGDYNGAKRYTKKIISATYIFYLVVNINIFTFRVPLTKLFSLSPEASEMAISFLMLHCISATLFWALAFSLPQALKAAGDARYVMIVAACTMWLLRVSAAYIFAFPLGLGPIGVWLAMGIDFILRSIFFTVRWLRGSWMKKRVI